MFADGIVEEVRALRGLDRPISKEAAQTVGYAEISAFLDGRFTKEECLERIQTRTRQFSKRQMTWFRHIHACRPATRELTISLWGMTMDGLLTHPSVDAGKQFHSELPPDSKWDHGGDTEDAIG
jgi:tRNA A37 N6-isopentenylltransferase MiaA